MTFSSSLDDEAIPIVLDTSVLINLHASTYGVRILTLIPNPIVVPRLVVQELQHETSKENGEYHFVKDIVDSGRVEAADFSESEFETFGAIVSGGASLGDGEAATLALASNRRCIAVIDERKGRARARILIPDMICAWSLDIILHPKVTHGLGDAATKAALYKALKDGRMRIHEEHCDHVVDLLGARAALDCVCLPNYKQRQHEWLKLDT